MPLSSSFSSRAATLTVFGKHIQQLGEALGFQALGFSDIDLSAAEQQLQQWLAKGFHGEMDWMAKHGTKRSRPAELLPNTVSVIAARMNYLPPDSAAADTVLNHPQLGYISRYALGRDYHKVLKKQLQKLAEQITESLPVYQAQFAADHALDDSQSRTSFNPHQFRVFVDSAPVLEKPLAIKAGLGWLGKHTNVLSRDAGSWFFLGEIYSNIPLSYLQTQAPYVQDHCGQCTACIDVCPTQAIIAPHQLDARRCISYLTIELKGSIPEQYRKAIGNRIYGCDDCQLICPWNRFAQTSTMADFAHRHQLDATHLLDLFAWSEQAFLDYMAGSAIRRIGYERWQRNLAVALGNAKADRAILQALHARLATATPLVAAHIHWAIEQQQVNDNKA